MATVLYSIQWKAIKRHAITTLQFLHLVELPWARTNDGKLQLCQISMGYCISFYSFWNLVHVLHFVFSPWHELWSFVALVRWLDLGTRSNISWYPAGQTYAGAPKHGKVRRFRKVNIVENSYSCNVSKLDSTIRWNSYSISPSVPSCSHFDSPISQCAKSILCDTSSRLCILPWHSLLSFPLCASVRWGCLWHIFRGNVVVKSFFVHDWKLLGKRELPSISASMCAFTQSYRKFFGSLHWSWALGQWWSDFWLTRR